LMELQSEIAGKIEEKVKIIGNIKIGENSIIKNGSFIKGPVIIGKNTEIENAYIGPYTSIGDNCKIKNCEIESSIIIGGTTIDIHQRIVNSLIGKDTKILSANNRLPKGYKFILGENSEVEI